MNLFQKSVVILFLLLSGLSVKAQLSNLDKRLVDFYGMEHLAKLNQSAPGTVEYLNFYVQNAYVIMRDMPEYKLANLNDLASIKNLKTGENINLENLKNLNVLELGLKRRQDQHLNFRIGNSNDAIVFIAPNEVRRRYEEEGEK